MDENIITPVILSGGIGSRLWPISREEVPKYSMHFDGDKTMLEATLARLKVVKYFGKPIVVCNYAQRHIVTEQLQRVGIVDFFVIVEPVSRNTAPALAAAAIKINKFIDKKCVCLAMPIDHCIEDVYGFSDILTVGFRYAKNGFFIVYGVPPIFPETGYGYIRKGELLSGEGRSDSDGKLQIFRVEQFVEKPEFERASYYFNSKNYFWNSGIFMFRSDCIISELNNFAPDIVKFSKMSVSMGNYKDYFFYLEKQAFSKCPKKSIDHAIMERTSNCLVVPMNVGWKDLGSWESLYQNSKKDSNGNVVKGDVVLHNVKNSYINSRSRLVTAVDLKEHAVIETGDAVLVTSIKKSQNVKCLVNKLREKHRRELFTNEKCKNYYQWGIHERIFTSEILTIDYISINPGEFIFVAGYLKSFSKGKLVVIRGQALIKNTNTCVVLSSREHTNFGVEHDYHIYNTAKDKSLLKLVIFTGDSDFFV